jgi:hypothetical protein
MLIQCTSSGVHGDDYKERRLLGYKTPVRTSQETYYISVTEPIQLMLWKIWSVHGGDYEECRLLGCDAVWLLLSTDVSKECIHSIIRVKRISELGITLAGTSNWSTLRRNTDLAHWIFLPCLWKQYIPPKRQLLQEQHGITSEKAAFYMRTQGSKFCNITPYSTTKVDRWHCLHFKARDYIWHEPDTKLHVQPLTWWLWLGTLLKILLVTFCYTRKYRKKKKLRGP